MNPKRATLFLITLFGLISLACNAFAGNVEPGVELPPPIVESTLAPGATQTIDGIAPTATLPAGTGTAVADSTTEPPIEGPYVSVLVDLNVRVGPGVQYDRVGFLLQGTSVPAIGVDPASGWWKIQCPADIVSTECWVSGGSQYSQGYNTDDLPAAPIPPTPTAPPTATPTADPTADTDTGPSGTGLVAYADNGGLWAVPLNLSQSPPSAGTPIQLSAATDISRPLISPDGEKVAFLRGDASGNVLGFLNSDGDGGDILVASISLPNATGSDDVAILIDQFAWMPDSESLVFSSVAVNQVGPGASPQEDLWQVSLSGQLRERFAAGEGGHAFALAPNGNQVIFSLPQSIVQVNMDGSNRQTALTFSAVNTASEYAYVPVVQWLANGSTAVTAVSGPDPWQGTASASLYRIANGNALVQGSLNGNILFNPVQWTSDGNKLGYVRFIPDGGSSQTLILADGSGTSSEQVRTGQNLRSFGWNPANSYLLYAGEGFAGVVKAGVAPVELSLPSALSDAQWLLTDAFVMNVGSGNVWNLTSGNLSGETRVVATASGSGVAFDVWAP